MELVVAFSPCSAKPQINTNAPISIAKSFNKRILTLSTRSKATTNTFTPLTHANSSNNSYWMVHMNAPPTYLNSKPQIIDYYVTTLQTILGCESDAQMCIYEASGHSDFGFCCEIDDQAAQELARIPGVLSVKPDNRYSSPDKDYNYSEVELSSFPENLLLFPDGTTKHWLVRTNPPTAGALSKAQAVDYFAQILTQVLGNKKDAEMCIYHVSWASDYGFCCELDEKCAKELTDVPGVIGVHPDTNFDSDDKDYRGLTSNINTKKIFVTGLSFYTSEKTLRAAFDVFGELTEVKIIMDKISKRSKGYAFIEYTTEEAASTALREMNGKIINGWMITVDVAKKNPPKYGRGRSS